MRRPPSSASRLVPLVLALGVLGCGGSSRECESDAECSSAEQPFCVDAVCAECRTTADCSDGAVCQAGVCQAGDLGLACDADETRCDGEDDDCNGLVDDVDRGSDGINDCLSILFVGQPGDAGDQRLEAWLAERGATVARVGDGEDPDTIDETVLAPHQIVIVDALLRAYTAPEADSIASFVDAGNGVVFMAGYRNEDSDALRPNTILPSFQMLYEGDFVTGAITSFPSHPTTEGLERIVFGGGHPIMAAPTLPATSVAEVDGRTVGVAVERGDGRVFVWGDELVQYPDQWGDDVSGERFWQNVLRWVGPLP